MPLITFTTMDVLTERLRNVLEEIAHLDIDQDLAPLRVDPHAKLDQIAAAAVGSGYTLSEVYDSVMAWEEGRADYQSEAGEGNELGE